MKKTIRTFAALLLVSAIALAVAPLSGQAAPQSNPSAPSSPDTALPWLKTLNGQIVRADNNQRVELRGANVLHNEWVYPSMTFEEAAIPVLASSWHANLITHGFASAPVVANDAQYLAVLDEYQQLAEQNNMYIIFAYYYPTINGDQPPNPDVDPNSQQALVNLVQRYRTKSNVMFMLQAEPHSDTWNGTYYRVTWNTLRPTYDQMITAMRAVDNAAPQKHLILASGDGYGRDISPVITNGEVGHPDPITADGAQNIVYSSHPYDTQGGSNNWDYFLPVADAGYPVLVTEFGTGGQMNQSDTIALMNEMNNGTRHISWTSWIFDSGGCPCLTSSGGPNFPPTSPYGMSVHDRIIAEATNFGGGNATNTPSAATATRTNTAVPANTATRTGTSTATHTRTVTRTPTNTPVPPTATNTSVPPTASNTAVPSTATNTPLPATATRTNTPVPPTNTAVAPTSTPVPPTPTRTPVPPTATNTPGPLTPTNTPAPPTLTYTPVPNTATNTSTRTRTATNTPAPGTATNTPVPATVTNTSVPPTVTNTSVPPTATNTNTPVQPSVTRTNTPVQPSVTRTNTPVPPSVTRTNTVVVTGTPPTATNTNTPAPATATNTPAPPTATTTPAPATATTTPTPATATTTPAPATATNTPAPPTETPMSTAEPTSNPELTATATETEVACPPPNYSDVSPGDYFYAAVQYLSCRGAISGYSDGTFRPYSATTRGQLSKIIVLAEGFPVDLTGAPHFSDVSTSNPFYIFIETAYNRGLVSGYSDSTFRWSSNVTRGQLSKIAVLAGGWPFDTTGGPHFTDVPTSHPFYGFIETAYNHGIISGYSDGTFRPGNNATRGQIAKIVYQAIQP